MQDDNVLLMTFTGRQLNRTVCLRYVQLVVAEFVAEEPMRLGALFREIFKNIWDHADGKGRMKIEKDTGTFRFEIRNESDGPYDIERCRQGSSKMGNGINFGCGVAEGIIEEMAQSLNIELKIDPIGFTYSGVYTPMPRR